MVVHTFNKTDEWLDDYQYFLSLFDVESGVNQAVSVELPSGIPLVFARVHGSEKYLES